MIRLVIVDDLIDLKMFLFDKEAEFTRELTLRWFVNIMLLFGAQSTGQSIDYVELLESKNC